MLYSPWYLLFLLLLPWLAWRMFRRKSSDAVVLSSTSTVQNLKPSLRQRLLWLPPVLTLMTLLALILGLARPREGRQQTVSEGEGIAIQFVVDKSGSMEAMDFAINGQNVDRLSAIKSVVKNFILGGHGLEGRASDLTGLITFAKYADSVTPLTLDHTFFMAALNQARIVRERSESGTAIGDALALAVEKLSGTDPSSAEATSAAADSNLVAQSKRRDKVKSKVVILLTDGENNSGSLEPMQAAELAKAMGIRVYTIGVGSNSEIPVPMLDPFTQREVIRWARVSIDEATLTDVANLTGGKYFRATDTDSLEKIYAEIDQLERSRVETRQFVDYREMAVQSTRWSWMKVPPVLWIAYMLLAGRVLLELTWLRYGI